MEGKVWKFGSNVDTDVIIPGKYLSLSDPEELGKHCMEGIDEDFPRKINQGDIIVADENFGCGSSREHAPIAIKAIGISCVIAKSFAGIFYRNSINIGLEVIASPEVVNDAEQGDLLEVNAASGKVVNFTKNKTYEIPPLPEFIQDIVSSGGLMGYLAKRLSSEKV